MNVPKNEYFLGTYIGWRETRIKKIESIFGKEFFKGKTILELACGYGHTGKYFKEELGAVVTLAEGNGEYISAIKENNPDSEVIQLDQDYSWDLGRKFDVIIHWGVLYHLDNWKQDLECALNHTDLLLLESEVGLSNAINYEVKFNDYDYYDQAINVVATRPSASYIENVITKNNFNFTRYDDADINYQNHRYDWKVPEKLNEPETRKNDGNRRFWVVRKNI